MVGLFAGETVGGFDLACFGRGKLGEGQQVDRAIETVFTGEVEGFAELPQAGAQLAERGRTDLAKA